eukprot:4710961-Pyramimonas_sp.AAC.1
MVAQWWTRMRDVVLTRPSQAPLFCLLDANATVGTVQSSHASPVGAEEDNDTGHLFQFPTSYRTECGVYLFGTFPRHTWYAVAAWRGPSGPETSH